jgi:hypothetical protein
MARYLQAHRLHTSSLALTQALQSAWGVTHSLTHTGALFIPPDVQGLKTLQSGFGLMYMFCNFSDWMFLPLYAYSCYNLVLYLLACAFEY